jgi:Uma2 family endonuclease
METPDPISDYERERGKPPPSKAHGYTQENLTIALTRYRDRYTMFSELTLELDGREIVPDLSVYPKTDVDLIHDEVRVTEPPLLAIEIATTTQNTQDLIERVEFLLDAGVQSCWLVQPPLRTVTVFPGSMDGNTVSSGAVTDPVLDIEVPIDAIFDPDE